MKSKGSGDLFGSNKIQIKDPIQVQRRLKVQQMEDK